jgi:hypothetical protein
VSLTVINVFQVVNPEVSVPGKTSQNGFCLDARPQMVAMSVINTMTNTESHSLISIHPRICKWTSCRLFLLRWSALNGDISVMILMSRAQRPVSLQVHHYSWAGQFGEQEQAKRCNYFHISHLISVLIIYMGSCLLSDHFYPTFDDNIGFERGLCWNHGKGQSVYDHL